VNESLCPNMGAHRTAYICELGSDGLCGFGSAIFTNLLFD